jgi:simple sugar transport system permease protein
MTDVLVPFLEATVRTATPLALAALGETITERSGVINVGLEGAIIAGCFGALAATAGGVALGLAGGVAGGLVIGLLLAVFVVGLRADQIIAGTALTLGAYGATGTLYRVVFGESGVALSVPTLRPAPIPILADLPVIGPALFAQPPLTYVLLCLVPLVWWWLHRTHAGLALRAIGERPSAALMAGVHVSRWRAAAVLTGSAFGGLAGATLVLAQVGTFSEQMSAGRGFIALAVVALGRWTPQGALAAALLFGAASALQYRFQAQGSELPYQVFLALPYALTLLVLAGGVGRARAPAALARPDAGHE